MSLRQLRSLFRFVLLELIDDLKGLRGKSRLSVRFSRRITGGFILLRTRVLGLLGLRSLSGALDLSVQALYVNASLVGLAFITLMILMVQGDLTNK